MLKKEDRLKNSQIVLDACIKETNARIEKLGLRSNKINSDLNELQLCFDLIRNVPSKKHLKVEELKKIRSNWKEQVDKIESDYKLATKKCATGAVGGLGAGVGVVTLAPTATMGIATTFGVASTGTAISTLSGAAATNAALAWLGGGALTAGGGGMAAGSALLALSGPIGWTIAGTTLIGSAFLLLKSKTDKEKIGDIFTLISVRDSKYYQLAMAELNERIKRIDDESNKLNEAIKRVKAFGTEYDVMTEKQKYELGSYINLMNSSTQLLVNPILGLKPKYSDSDYDKYMKSADCKITNQNNDGFKSVFILLANLLYKIDLDDKDKKILWKTIRNDKEFLSIISIRKKDFGFEIVDEVSKALDYKYFQED